MSKKIVLTGGGTAGHVTPNMALIPKLRELDYEIVYMGSYDGIEKKLIEDFGLHIKVEDRNKYKRTHQSRNTLISKKPKVVMIREKLEQWLKHATDVLIRYLKWIQFWKEIYKPEPDEEWHELFTEALANERKINDYLDVLMFGTGEEIVEFFKMKRREVEKIEERINEYQREVLDGIRRYCERGNAYNRRCQ